MERPSLERTYLQYLTIANTILRRKLGMDQSFPRTSVDSQNFEPLSCITGGKAYLRAACKSKCAYISSQNVANIRLHGMSLSH